MILMRISLGKVGTRLEIDEEQTTVTAEGLGCGEFHAQQLLQSNLAAADEQVP